LPGDAGLLERDGVGARDGGHSEREGFGQPDVGLAASAENNAEHGIGTQLRDLLSFHGDVIEGLGVVSPSLLLLSSLARDLRCGTAG